MIPSVIVPITRKEILGAIKVDLFNNKNKILEFEQKCSEYLRCDYTIATSSGTSALYVLLKAYGMKKGDEIIMPAYTCEGVARLIVDMGYNINFVDVEKENYNINIDDLCNRVSRRTKAILSIHMFGNPCEMKDIVDIANDCSAVVIEDSAQAMGAEYRGEKVGTIGDSGFFSLGVGKPITTMTGGLIATNDEEIRNKSKKIISNFREDRRHDIEFFVKAAAYFTFRNPYIYNLAYWMMLSRRVRKRERCKTRFDLEKFEFKYTNMQASIGAIQLSNLDWFNDTRTINANFLIDHLSGVDGIHLPKIAKYSKPIYLRLPIWVDNTIANQRDDLIYKLQKSGIDASVAYPHSLPRFFLDSSGYPNTEKLVEKTFTLPTHPLVKENDLKKIVDVIRGY